jgi:hypothetical protein
LKKAYDLNIRPATILDLTRRASDAVQFQYHAILKRIRDASVLHIDKTSIDVQGKLHWIWTFSTPKETFFVIKMSRGTASSVSRIARELDEKVEEFLKRPIEHPISYLFVDASHFKVRTNSRYAAKAFSIVVGIRRHKNLSISFCSRFGYYDTAKPHHNS